MTTSSETTPGSYRYRWDECTGLTMPGDEDTGDPDTGLSDTGIGVDDNDDTAAPAGERIPQDLSDTGDPQWFALNLRTQSRAETCSPPFQSSMDRPEAICQAVHCGCPPSR